MRKKYFFRFVWAILVFWIACNPSVLHDAAAAGTSPESRPDEGQGQVRGFVYHHFGMEEKYPSTSVSMDQFEDHLQYLDENGYTVLTLGRAVDLLYSDEQVPEKTAVITIDDAYRSVYENAVPLLEEYGWKATIFVPTSHIGGSNYMSWSQLAELHDKGFEIANHSHSHEYFLNHPESGIAENFEQDLEKSHLMFSRHLDMTPDLYAYPFGEYHPEIVDVLKKRGYRAAAAQKSGVMDGRGDRFLLPRFPMNVNYAEMESFAEKIPMKALGVVEARPESPVVSGENPPEVRLLVKNSRIRDDGIQCFVSGQANCDISYERDGKTLKIRAKSKDSLAARRVLYTITAPSRDGSEWFWYSHLWIMPEYGE